jgi:hypothetical protein
MIASTLSIFKSVVGEVAVGCPFAVAVSGRPVRAKRFCFAISLLWRPFSFSLSFAFSFPLRLVLDLSEPFWCIFVDLTRLGLAVRIIRRNDDQASRTGNILLYLSRVGRGHP